MTTSRPWTTTTCGAGGRRATAASARGSPSSSATRCPPRPSTPWRARAGVPRAGRVAGGGGGQVIGGVAAAAGEGGMVGGQALDLAAAGRATTLARVREIHRWKTGALLRVAVRTGALVAGANGAVLRRLTAYGEHLGLAFQIADDLLDAAGGPEADGRTDRELGKATYPGVLGVDR